MKKLKMETLLFILFLLALCAVLYCFNYVAPGILAFWQAGAKVNKSLSDCTSPLCVASLIAGVVINGATIFFIVNGLVLPSLSRNTNRMINKTTTDANV